MTPMGTAGWLDGRVAVITGAGTGIGAAVAARFVAEGGSVVLVGRRPGPLRDTAAGLGDRALAVPGDAAAAADMAGVVATATARFGGVDILVANAGGPGGGTAADVTDEAWSQSIGPTCPPAWSGAGLPAGADQAARLRGRGVRRSPGWPRRPSRSAT